MAALKFLVSIFFLWTIFDRITSTFKRASFSDKKFTQLDKIYSLFIISIYTAIILNAYLNFLSEAKKPSVIITFFGIAAYLISRNIRAKTIRAMGRQWVNHASATEITKIVNWGPYRYSRHPYYWATVIDLLAYSMIFGEKMAAILAIFIFIPLMWVRIFLEEKNLTKKFGDKYQKYKNQVSAIFSVKRFLYNTPVVKDMLQVFEVSLKFGIGKIFLMQSLKHTISQYSRGYAVSRITGALIEIGFVQSIVEEGQVDLVRFCNKRDVDFETLKIVCDYLAVLNIIKKESLKYSITDYGKKLFRDTRGAFSLLYAYMPIFEVLPDILLKRKRYGKDVFRRIDFVGIGSNELSALLPFPYAGNLLKQYKLMNVLDIGCGAGDFLLNACETGDLAGCGIDISREAIDIAQARLENIENTAKIQFKVCDLNKIHLRAKEFRDHDVISFMFVLHEFLSGGHDGVVDILKKMRFAFPGAKVFIAEVYKLTVRELIQKKPPVTEHHLFHKLSKQGLAT